MQYDVDNGMLEDVQEPIETAVQYKEFGTIAKRTGGAAIAIIMLFLLPNIQTSQVIAEKVSLAGLTCGTQDGLHRNTCDMPTLGRASRELVSAAVIRTQ